MTSHRSLLTQLARAVARGPAAAPLTWRACYAMRDLLGADGASLTVENSAPHRVTLCATDGRADQLEDLQDVLGEGPYLDAFDLGRPVIAAPGNGTVSPWPVFATSAGQILGPRGVLWSIPMRLSGQPIGAVSMYRVATGALRESVAAAQFMADRVAVLVLMDPLAFAEAPPAGIWSSRAVVHQATGMLIAQLGIAPEGALAILRSHAFACSAALREVARKVVDRKLDLARL